MTDILIYGGLSVLLIGVSFILIASIKGAIYTKGLPPTDFAAANDIKKRLRKYSRPGFILIITGAIIAGIGIVIGMN
ncbi:hypothetical protein [uncultured Duncaniella sp.]|uniref:hypothetical protein n=1 Tax=uncultured Duncaniella sp. TaxID=2768039 RepID=UPI0025FE7B3F|nr:hypothetical protein [uncultured Duncaniella sp.]